MSTDVPNMDADHAPKSPTLEHLYPEPTFPLTVFIAVPPDDPHWSISWQIGTSPSGAPVHRVLQLSHTETHFANLGPVTLVLDDDRYLFPVAPLSCEQREMVEQIAEDVPVRTDGSWNAQDWVVSVLKRAVEEEVISEAHRRAALRMAGWSGHW